MTDLYFNGTKITQVPIVGTTTVGELRQTINNWLVPQGVTEYTIKIILKEGTVIPEVVFQSDTYNAINFQAQVALLPGGSIQVNQPVPIKVNTPNPTQPNPTQPNPTHVNTKEPTQHTEAGLRRLKVTELKDILRNNRLKVGGNKADLITRILTNPGVVINTNPGVA